jgi:cell division protein FtsB
MKYGNRSPWKRFIYSPVGIIIGCIGLYMLTRAAWNIHKKAVVADERLSQAQAELSSLEQQKESLSSSISYLSTPAGMEAELRDKYHAVKAGESVAVIVDDASGSASSSGVSDGTSSTPSSGWWSGLLNFIGF